MIAHNPTTYSSHFLTTSALTIIPTERRSTKLIEIIGSFKTLISTNLDVKLKEILININPDVKFKEINNVASSHKSLKYQFGNISLERTSSNNSNDLCLLDAYKVIFILNNNRIFFSSIKIKINGKVMSK